MLALDFRESIHLFLWSLAVDMQERYTDDHFQSQTLCSHDGNSSCPFVAGQFAYFNANRPPVPQRCRIDYQFSYWARFLWSGCCLRKKVGSVSAFDHCLTPCLYQVWERPTSYQKWGCAGCLWNAWTGTAISVTYPGSKRSPRTCRFSQSRE